MAEEFNDFGFTTVDSIDPVDHSVEVEDLRKRLNAARDLVVPFLENLAKDPGRDIHWPDRDVKIEAFKKRLLDITG